MRSRVQLAGTVIAMALLVAGFPALAVAQDEGGPQSEYPQRELVPPVTLTGMVQADSTDGYLLVEQESGDSITLKGKKKKVAAHEGATVKVTGNWAKDDPSTKVFRVSKVEAAEAAVEAAPASPASPAPESPAPESPAPESPEPESVTPESAAPESPESPAPESPESPAPESPESPAPQP